MNSIKRVLVILAFELVFVLTAHAQEAVMTGDKTLNIRKQPSLSSDIVGYLETNAYCDILQSYDTWCFVRSGDISGYVLKKYLSTDKAALDIINREGMLKLKSNQILSIKEKPGNEYRTWDYTNTQSTYDVLSQSNGWIEIDLYGATGFVENTEAVTLFKTLPVAKPKRTLLGTSKQRTDIIDYAMKFLGGKYVWGGEDPNTGADCSGFVRYVYRNVTGIKLPRTSYTQCYSGTEISTTAMQPGDLIFYADAKGTVGHVTMYIGDGLIVHAASTKSGIIISKWNYRTPKYIRKILED